MITIISDIDGVLVDSKEAVYQSYRQAFAIQKKKFTKRDFNFLLWNQPFRADVFKVYFPTIDRDKLHKDKQTFYKTKRVIINWALVSLFFYLQEQGNELILVTGGSEEATKHKLANTDLKPNKIFCSCEKHPENFWQAIINAASNSNIWLFDDDEKVCRIAKRLGINVIQYNFKGNQNAS